MLTKDELDELVRRVWGEGEVVGSESRPVRSVRFSCEKMHDFATLMETGEVGLPLFKKIVLPFFSIFSKNLKNNL